MRTSENSTLKLSEKGYEQHFNREFEGIAGPREPKRAYSIASRARLQAPLRLFRQFPSTRLGE
jgi:hypothetical protein